MAFSTIDYDDGKASTYRGIELHYKENKLEKKIRFDTGDPVIDFYDFSIFIQDSTEEFYKENYFINNSSSWDHFLMDSKKINESYFDTETLEFLDWHTPLKNGDHKLFTRITEECPRVWHTKAMKNFSDVKKYYHKKKI